MEAAYIELMGTHRTNLVLDGELDCGVYAFGDIHEAVTKLEESNTEFPFGVIGIASSYIHKRAKALKALTKQTKIIS